MAAAGAVASLSAGSVRQMNVKNLLDSEAASVGTNRSLLGLFFAIGDQGLGPDGARWIIGFLNFAYAATAATIVAGTIAEKNSFKALQDYNELVFGFNSVVVAEFESTTLGLATLTSRMETMIKEENEIID